QRTPIHGEHVFAVEFEEIRAVAGAVWDGMFVRLVAVGFVQADQEPFAALGRLRCPGQDFAAANRDRRAEGARRVGQLFAPDLLAPFGHAHGQYLGAGGARGHVVLASADGEIGAFVRQAHQSGFVVSVATSARHRAGRRDAARELHAHGRAVVRAQLHAAVAHAVGAYLVSRHDRGFAPRAARGEEIDLKIAFADEEAVRAQATELRALTERGPGEQHLTVAAVDHRRSIGFVFTGQASDIEHAITVGVDQAARV